MPVDTPELDAVAEVARRRQKRWIVTITASAVTAGVLAGLVMSMVHHRHGVRHHTSAAGLAAGLAATTLTIAASLGFLYWLVKRGRGLFQAPLTLGLPYRDRRVVMKAVRRGTPPSEPTLRAVGLRMADRIVRYQKQTLTLYAVLALSQLANALIPGRPGWLRGLSVVAAVLLLGGLLAQRWINAGARRYIERFQQQPARQDGG